MKIDEDFWGRFVLLAKVCYHRDENIDLYDVFNIMRTKVLSGRPYTEEQINRIDAEIYSEEPILVGA